MKAPDFEEYPLLRGESRAWDLGLFLGHSSCGTVLMCAPWSTLDFGDGKRTTDVREKREQLCANHTGVRKSTR